MTKNQEEQILCGDQTPKTLLANDMFYLFWMAQVAPGKFEIIRDIRKFGTGEAELSDLIKSFPVFYQEEKELNRRIAIEAGRGFGDKYPHHGIMAYAGVGVMDKPFASVVINESGQKKYFARPDVDFYVKRYPS